MKLSNSLETGGLFEMPLKVGGAVNFLTLIEPFKKHNGKRNRSFWKVKCVCGKVFDTRTDALNNGKTESCGCKHPKTGPIKHGLRYHRVYKIFTGMKQRCYNENNHKYPQYGGRGITICDEWLNDVTRFYDWAIDHGYKDNLSIDRINNDKGYSPENCRWENSLTQSRNRRIAREVEIKGKNKCFSEWCEIYGINRKTAADRLGNGWSEIDAITIPAGGKR